MSTIDAGKLGLLVWY